MSQYTNNHLSKDQVESYGVTYSKGYFYNQWEYIEKPYLQEKFKSLSEDGAKNYLDLACGRGRILSLGGQYFDNTVGVDISEEMLKYAQENCTNANLFQFNISEIQGIGQFDIITIFRFFLNAEKELRKVAIDKIKELLTPDGKFITNIHVNKTSVRGYTYRLRNKLTTSCKANTEGFYEFQEFLNLNGIIITDVYWYSYFPRIGRLTDPVSKFSMTQLEKYCNSKPFIPESLCECFMLTCEVDK